MISPLWRDDGLIFNKLMADWPGGWLANQRLATLSDLPMHGTEAKQRAWGTGGKTLRTGGWGGLGISHKFLSADRLLV